MWPFTRHQPPEKPVAIAQDPLPERDRDRLTRLEHEFRQLQLEWSDTLDRIQRWASRQAARERQRVHRDLEAQENGDGLESAEDAPGATNAEGATIGRGPDAKAALRAQVNRSRIRGMG